MRGYIIIYILLQLLFSCKTNYSNREDLRLYLDDNNIEIKDSAYVFGVTYNIITLLKITIDGLEFYAGTDDTEKIVFLKTFDKNFVTPDSVKIGDKFSEIKSISTFETAYSDNFVYRLNSGWKAIVKYEYYQYQKFPDDSSRVSWLEKFEE